KPCELAEEQCLRFGELDRVGEPRPQQRRQRLGCSRQLTGCGVGSEFRVRACRELGKSRAAAFKRLQKVRCELFWIGYEVVRKKRTRFVAVLRHVKVKNFPLTKARPGGGEFRFVCQNMGRQCPLGPRRSSRIG